MCRIRLHGSILNWYICDLVFTVSHSPDNHDVAFCYASLTTTEYTMAI